MREKRLFIWVDIRKSPILRSLRHPIDKTGSTTLFSFEDAFPSVKLSTKKLKRFINDSNSKENKSIIDVMGWITAQKMKFSIKDFFSKWKLYFLCSKASVD